MIFQNLDRTHRRGHLEFTNVSLFCRLSISQVVQLATSRVCTYSEGEGSSLAGSVHRESASGKTVITGHTWNGRRVSDGREYRHLSPNLAFWGFLSALTLSSTTFVTPLLTDSSNTLSMIVFLSSSAFLFYMSTYIDYMITTSKIFSLNLLAKFPTFL